MTSSDAPAIKTISRGASIQSFSIAGQEILLSFPHKSLFSTLSHPHFGETIGRVTNRIANAKLSNLNGKEYLLYANNGPNTLHGGKIGWGAREWEGPFHLKQGQWEDGVSGVRPEGWNDSIVRGKGREGWGYTLKSADGEEGFPGAVIATVHYFEGRGQRGEVVLDVEYEIKWQDGDASGATETVVGITNHAYFNLNLALQTTASLANHTASITSNTYLKLIPDSGGIPDGSFDHHPEVQQANTPFNLATESGHRPIDDCFILNQEPSSIPLDTRLFPLQELVTAHGDASGLNLKVESTEPAFQLYTGGFTNVPPWPAGEVDGHKYEGGSGYGPGSGFCVEPSRYVNAAANENWRCMCLLKKGQVFGCRSRYWGWKD